MSSRVTRSPPSLITPAEPTPAGAIPLTAMDRALASLPMAALLVFQNRIDQPAATIRTALSRALVPYYPMAGRLTLTAGVVIGAGDGDDQHLKIACTGEGAAFVAASASCTLLEAGLAGGPRPVVAVDDLTMTMRSYAGAGEDPPPLLLVQVTEFSCGGFVVGVTWNHVVADGAGMAQFLRAVGEFARGGSLSLSSPVRVDPALPELPPPVTAMTRALVAGNHTDFPSSYITVPLSFIDRVKDEFRRRNSAAGGQSPAAASCTAFDVFTATIWKCRGRATIAGAGRDDAPTAMAFTANVRKAANAVAGYYGNVFAFGVAASTVGEVAGGDVVELVGMVRDAKARVARTFAVDGAAACIADEVAGGRRLRGQLDVYDTLYVTSWWNLGLDDVDFGGGGGGAARVFGDMERKVVPACILCGSKDKAAEGVVAAMALCVKPEHAEEFHAQLRSLK